MILDVIRLLAARPFETFTIVTSGGNRYFVPTREHAATNPLKTRVMIWFDDGSGVDVPGLHISSIEKALQPHT